MQRPFLNLKILTGFTAESQENFEVYDQTLHNVGWLTEGRKKSGEVEDLAGSSKCRCSRGNDAFLLACKAFFVAFFVLADSNKKCRWSSSHCEHDI
jgi:hypothetical protein